MLGVTPANRTIISTVTINNGWSADGEAGTLASGEDLFHFRPAQVFYSIQRDFLHCFNFNVNDGLMRAPSLLARSCKKNLYTTAEGWMQTSQKARARHDAEKRYSCKIPSQREGIATMWGANIRVLKKHNQASLGTC